MIVALVAGINHALAEDVAYPRRRVFARGYRSSFRSWHADEVDRMWAST